jgi:hypothetical protein
MAEVPEFDFKEFLRHSLEFGKSVILEDAPRELSPQVMILFPERGGIGIAAGLLHLDREYWPGAIEGMLEQTRGFAYVILSEAWVSVPQGMAQDSATMAAMRHSSLADLDVPKREVLMAAYSGPGGGQMLTIEILEGRKAFGETMEVAVELGRLVNIGGVCGPPKD